MRRMEVRCCCQPVKVLGTLPVLDQKFRTGGSVQFPVMGDLARGLPRSSIEFEIATWECSTMDSRDGPPRVFDRQGGLALKHEGITLETLRRIPGFIEAKES